MIYHRILHRELTSNRRHKNQKEVVSIKKKKIV